MTVYMEYEEAIHVFKRLKMSILGLNLRRRDFNALLLALSLISSRAHAAYSLRRSITFSDYLGMNTPFIMFPLEVQKAQIRRMTELGLKWVRIDLHWYYLEPAQGQYDFVWLDALVPELQKAGLQPLVYVVGSARYASMAPPDALNIDQYPPRNPADLANLMSLLARRYPHVTCWQIWNEPNINPFWQPKEDPVAYAKLLATVVPAVRQAAPDSTVVMAGMAYFSQMPLQGGLMLQELGKLNALSLTDVVGYHPYTDMPEGDPDPAEPKGIALASIRMQMVNSWLRAAGVQQIWATEWGWSTYQGEKVWQTIIDEHAQANYLLCRLVLMMEQDFDRIFWFALMDMDERVERRDRFYGLITQKAEAKPSFTALKNFLNVTGDRLDPADFPSFIKTTASYRFSWKKTDGNFLIFFWGAAGQSIELMRPGNYVLHHPVTGGRQLVKTGINIAVTPDFQILEIQTSQDRSSLQ